MSTLFFYYFIIMWHFKLLEIIECSNFVQCIFIMENVCLNFQVYNGQLRTSYYCGKTWLHQDLDLDWPVLRLKWLAFSKNKIFLIQTSKLSNIPQIKQFNKVKKSLICINLYIYKYCSYINMPLDLLLVCYVQL